MSDDISSNSRPAYGKTRSASISGFPKGSSLETIINTPTESLTPEDGTPNYRRRRVAARSQSARITNPRAVRKKPSQPQQSFQDSKSHFTSEPRLTETETPPQPRRRGSQRRPTPSSSSQQQYTPGRRKSNAHINAFLDVPGANFHHDLDDDDTVIRTFSSSKQGVINRGDSFRRRRSRSGSTNPPALSPMKSPEQILPVNTGPQETWSVAMLGGQEVGKAALISQFRTSECINAYDDGADSPNDQNISIILDGVESLLKFSSDRGDNKETIEKSDAYLVVYSVVDKSSFGRAEQLLNILQDTEQLRTKACILIGNKIDLVRSRAVSSQAGKCLACTYRVKFVEVSVGINHNVDELLAGTLTQIRLKREHLEVQGHKDGGSHWYKNRNVVKASMKARQMITWIFGKEDSKFKNCENLQVL